jgi:hypothetical protein
MDEALPALRSKLPVWDIRLAKNAPGTGTSPPPPWIGRLEARDRSSWMNHLFGFPQKAANRL